MTIVETAPKQGRLARASAVLIAVIAVLVALDDLVHVITVSTGRVLIALGGAEGRLPLSALPQLLQADLREGTTGYLTDAPWGLRLLAASPAAIHAVTVLWAALVLTGILRYIAGAKPFEAPAISGWRHLAFILVIGGALQGLADTFAVFEIAHLSTESMFTGKHLLGADYSGIGVNIPQWPILLIVLGIVAGSIAAAFRAGARLQEEALGVV
jgi:hypothetical protein